MSGSAQLHEDADWAGKKSTFASSSWCGHDAIKLVLLSVTCQIQQLPIPRYVNGPHLCCRKAVLEPEWASGCPGELVNPESWAPPPSLILEVQDRARELARASSCCCCWSCAYALRATALVCVLFGLFFVAFRAPQKCQTDVK